MFNTNEIQNSIFEGNCLEILKRFPDNSIDMVLCDLPYGTTQNKWDSVINLDLLWKEYKRIVKPNGAIVLTSQGVFTAKLILSNEQDFKYKLVWEKSKATNFLNAKKQPLRKHEDICVFYKKQCTYHPQMTEGKPYDKGIRKNASASTYGERKAHENKSSGERYPTDVVYFKTSESEAIKLPNLANARRGHVYHPTQKPVELGWYLIRTYSDENALILDNTFGSGSFLVSAVLENRRFVGIEQEPEFVKVAEERLKEAGAKVKVVRGE